MAPECVLKSVDIDLMYDAGNLSSGVSVPPADSKFDLNEDETVNLIDLNQWLLDAGAENGFSSPYLLGDANLNGIVNSSDLNLLALNWRANERLWSAGDFNADGVVNSVDLNSIALNWRSSIPSAASQTAAVPEPATAFLAVFALTALTCLRWRTRGT